MDEDRHSERPKAMGAGQSIAMNGTSPHGATWRAEARPARRETVGARTHPAVAQYRWVLLDQSISILSIFAFAGTPVLRQLALALPHARWLAVFQ